MIQFSLRFASNFVLCLLPISYFGKLPILPAYCANIFVLCSLPFQYVANSYFGWLLNPTSVYWLWFLLWQEFCGFFTGVGNSTSVVAKSCFGKFATVSASAAILWHFYRNTHPYFGSFQVVLR